MKWGWIEAGRQLQRNACHLARPLIQTLPAGRVRLLGWLGGGQGSNAWHNSKQPIRIFWDGDLQAWVQVDLRDWGGRWHYFAGRYYDQLLPWIMRSCLGTGDMFVDVGANFGIHSMRGAQLVGVDGRVVAIEPSPAARERLELHIAMNSLCNVSVIPAALGAEEGEATLHMDGDHLGTASLRDDRSLGDKTIPVAVKTLDSIIDPLVDNVRTLVKIDVEGFELETVCGAKRWLQRPNTCFVVEVTPEWITAMGGHPQELFARFVDQGYCGYLISRQRRWNQEIPQFKRVDSPAPQQADYLFVRPDERVGKDLLGESSPGGYGAP